jgi:hypothetical protein
VDLRQHDGATDRETDVQIVAGEMGKARRKLSAKLSIWIDNSVDKAQASLGGKAPGSSAFAGESPGDTPRTNDRFYSCKKRRVAENTGVHNDLAVIAMVRNPSLYERKNSSVAESHVLPPFLSLPARI